MSSNKIRYAVLGLGHIAQNAVLPTFKQATCNSELTTLISGDNEKLIELGKLYHVPHLYSYDEFDKALAADTFDAVYIALPNDMHKDYCIRAANCGVSVLCEKPMALTSEDCQEMIAVCESNKVKL